MADMVQWRKRRRRIRRGEGMRSRIRVLGNKHPDVATTYNNMGSVYRSMGDLDKALEMADKVLSIAPELFQL
jgi:tetratricopeptide (TPR) repeat protein